MSYNVVGRVWQRLELTTFALSPSCRYAISFRTHSHGFSYPEQSEVDKYYPQYYHKTDKEGRPVYIEQLGKLDISKLYALTSQDRQLHHLVDEYEKFLSTRLPACSAQQGQLVETSCTILDLSNAGISSFYKGGSGGECFVRSCAHASQGLRLGCQ